MLRKTCNDEIGREQEPEAEGCEGAIQSTCISRGSREVKPAACVELKPRKLVVIIIDLEVSY